jgi:hypothetical protein
MGEVPWQLSPNFDIFSNFKGGAPSALPENQSYAVRIMQVCFKIKTLNNSHISKPLNHNPQPKSITITPVQTQRLAVIGLGYAKKNVFCGQNFQSNGDYCSPAVLALIGVNKG